MRLPQAATSRNAMPGLVFLGVQFKNRTDLVFGK